MPPTLFLRLSALALGLWLGTVGGAAPRPARHDQPDLNRSAGLGTEAGLVLIPAGFYEPLIRSPKDLVKKPVAAFWLDEQPITNGQFLAFVRAHPRWQRSQISRLFADSSYLEHWASDLNPGAQAPLNVPVVRISWFAARAYARWVGRRLPTTAEWELAAAAGYTRPDGKNDEVLQHDLYAWLARPVPPIQSAVTTARRNLHGARGLHGFVWEWVDDFNTALVTGESRADTGLERDRYCGAGSLGAKDTSDYAAFMRQALRASLQANNTTTSLGFRCAQDFSPPIPR
jgi:formylglycine-generating enzyme required for sulfatase activity